MAVSKNDINDKVQLLMKKGMWKKALVEMDKLYALDRNDPQISLRIGDLYVKLNDKDNAAKNYIKAAGKFTKMGQVPKAIATYKMCMRTDPTLTGVQDLIDELVGEPAKPAPSADKSKLKVDLSKMIPGLEDVAAGMPDEPQPQKVEDKGPVYDIDAAGGVAGVSAKEFGYIGIVKKTQGKPVSIELDSGRADMDSIADEGLIGGNASLDIDTGRADFGAGGLELSEASGAYEIETTGGGFELDTGRADDNASHADTDYSGGEPLDLDSGRADDVPFEGVSGLAVEPPMDEPPADDEEVEEILQTPEEPEPVSGPIPLLFDLSREELWELLNKMKRREIEAGTVIVKEGEEGDSLFIIKKGKVRVVTKVSSKEIVLATLGERDFFGEVSFLTGRPRTADIIADEDSELMELTRDDLNAVIKSHPKVEGVLRMFHESRVTDTVTTLKAVAKDFFK